MNINNNVIISINTTIIVKTTEKPHLINLIRVNSANE